MATGNVNPYATPHSEVQAASTEYAEVKMFSFGGRLGRVRYMAYMMGLMLAVWLGGGLLVALTVPSLSKMGGPVASIVSAVLIIGVYGFMLVGSFTLAVRRIHDFNTSGWLSLLFLIPFVNFIFGLALWFIPGTAGANRFGQQTPPNGTGVTIAAVLAPLALVTYIGVMAAIAIPAYQQYVERAKQTQMKMQQQQQQQQQQLQR